MLLSWILCLMVLFTRRISCRGYPFTLVEDYQVLLQLPSLAVEDKRVPLWLLNFG